MYSTLNYLSHLVHISKPYNPCIMYEHPVHRRWEMESQTPILYQIDRHEYHYDQASKWAMVGLFGLGGSFFWPPLGFAALVGFPLAAYHFIRGRV